MRARGFTLIEMIIVITITGIIASIVAVFMRVPVQGYADAARRAHLTDTADTTLRRIARDVQSALPNSLRPNAACVANTTTLCGIELLPTLTGGRYRQDDACFSTGCTTLTSLGSVITANGEHSGRRVTIYNLHNNDGANCSSLNPSAWCGQNVATIIASTDSSNNDQLNFAATTFAPGTGSPSRSFFIVGGPVAYVCSNVGTIGDNGTGVLRRYENYVAAGTPTLPPAGASGQLIARNVSACNINYAPAVSGTDGLLQIYLEITEAGEAAGLYHEVHVDNAP